MKCSIQNRSLDIYGISYPYCSIEGEAERNVDINGEIESFLMEYCSSFDDSVEFQIDYEVMQEYAVLSILFSGYVYTPSRPIAQAFAINFDLESGQMLSLENFASSSDILELLATSAFQPLSKEKAIDVQEQESPHVAYQLYRVITGDENHKYDFYLDSEYFYVIISTSATYGYYSIYKMNYRK